MSAQRPILAVVGAGPKAVAIGARASALEELAKEGFRCQPPELVVFEHQGVAANWLGGRPGYTDGRRLLVTPPEKDVGFPYASEIGGDLGARVDELMRGRYSWQAFKTAHGKYAEWIDRGRPLITHREYGEYLVWVSQQCQLGTIEGRVTEIQADGNRWRILHSLSNGQRVDSFCADGVVVTGPGQPKRLPDKQDSHPNICDGKTFWEPGVLRGFRVFERGKIAVIGVGDTAATVVVALLEILPTLDQVKIDIISTSGVRYSRGESYDESRFFSDPRGWKRLRGKRGFFDRTERAVFSSISMTRIDQAPNVETLTGRVLSAQMAEKDVVLTVEGRTKPWYYDRVVVAMGFDALRLRLDLFPEWHDLFPPVARGMRYPRALAEFSRRIGRDLSCALKRPAGRAHFPGLAGYSQGPGFPNLGCLGRMAERVLLPYLELH